jgi:N-acetylglucosaminyldiphosphoundecaprenol N-acetyl-beta-D-mannosaminyltransferase
MNRLSLGSINLDIPEPATIESTLQTLMTQNSPAQIVTLNALMFNLTKKNSELFDAVSKASFVIPDSAGIVWAVKFLYSKDIARFAGIKLIDTICSLAEKNGYGIFLLGSRKEVLEQTVNNLLVKYPKLKISGIQDGYFPAIKETEVISIIKNSKADILLTALNMPRQEIWISKHLVGTGVKLAMGVGGSFDVISGNLKRAPVWMQDLGLEWLFRFIQEPSRIIRIIGLPLFVFNICKIKYAKII